METQSTDATAYGYLSSLASSYYTEQKQDYDGPIYSQNESRIGLVSRLEKRETTKSLSLKEDEFIRPPLKLRDSRIVRLAIFLLLEAVWLGFGLIVYRLSIQIPSGDISVGRFSTSSTSLFEAAFGSLGILWQSLASLTISDVVQEIYSGEWHEMVQRQTEDQGRTIRDMEIVSTLVSGRMLQARHAFHNRHSTLRYKFAFVISLLLIALSALAPNAISISPVSSEKTLMIGAMNVNIDEDALSSFNMSYSQLLSEVMQFEYVVQLDGSPPEFAVKDVKGNPSSNALFGMPLRSDLGDTTDITRLSYISDAVSYNFTCQWLAPAPTSDLFTWAFGGDMTGAFDQASNVLNDVQTTVSSYFKIYPLIITDHGVGAPNGSFAWFISSFHNYSDVYWIDGQPYSYTLDVFLNLSSIPQSGRTFGNVSTSAFNRNPNDYALPLNTTTTDTVLFCDPHIQMSRAQVDISNDGSTLSFKTLEGHGSSPVGNIDKMNVSRILGRGLNGIPWEIDVVMFDNGHTGSSLGRLTAELLFLPPVQKPTKVYPPVSITYDSVNQTIYNPKSLSDISSKLNSWTSIAGMNTYLSGSLGNHTVPTTGIYATQRLVVNWSQWFANLANVLIVAGFIISLTIRDARKGKELVPLTVTTMKKYLRENRDDLET